MSWISGLINNPKRTDADMVRLNGALVAEFNEFVADHLQWAADNIPDNAMIRVELERDMAFNKWSTELVELVRDEDQPVFAVRFKEVSDGEKAVEIDFAEREQVRAR